MDVGHEYQARSQNLQFVGMHIYTYVCVQATLKQFADISEAKTKPRI